WGGCYWPQGGRTAPRGAKPKAEPGSATEPAALPSSVVIFNSISRSRCRLRFRRSGLFTLGRDSFGGFCLAFGQTELAGFRRFLWQLLFHRVPHRDPAAPRAGDCALDQYQSPCDVGLHPAQIERGDPLDAEMARHLLVLDRLAGILPPAGRTMRAVRDGNAVRSAQAAEIPALHRTGKTLADRCP